MISLESYCEYDGRVWLTCFCMEGKLGTSKVWKNLMVETFWQTQVLQTMTNWMLPAPICIFLVCREFNKTISKKFQKIGNFYVIFEITSKKIWKQNSFGQLNEVYALKRCVSWYNWSFTLLHSMQSAYYAVQFEWSHVTTHATYYEVQCERSHVLIHQRDSNVQINASCVCALMQSCNHSQTVHRRPHTSFTSNFNFVPSFPTSYSRCIFYFLSNLFCF